MLEEFRPANTSGRSMRRGEVLLLALVLVAAYHAIPRWMFDFLPTKTLYERLGAEGFANFWDALTLLVPLILCLAVPARSGWRIGVWQGRGWKVLGICILPIVLTAIVYPFTSQPFKGDRTGVWLISPAAQDLMFTGYLYGLLDSAFPGPIHHRFRVNKAIFLTSLFFALWHVPNFLGIQPSYVVFQLVYSFIGGAWVLLTRQLTGSVLPGIATHMAVNSIAVAGW